MARRVSASTWLWLPLLSTLPLLLFVDKPLHMDDPLYVWVARRVLQHPADFYGFDVNWLGRLDPMARVMLNPPLASYAFAAGGAVLGFEEVPLHLTAFLAALGFAAAVGCLARGLRLPAAPAVLLAVWSPPAFVSSTTLMAEPWLLASFTGCVAAWVRGHESGRRGWLWLAGLLGSLAFLCKYSGASVVPLLFAHGLWQRRRLGAWGIPLLLPLLAIAGYELYTRWLYGTAGMAQAADYAGHRPGAPLLRAAVGLAFLGGLELPVALLSVWTASRWARLAWAGIAVAIAAALLRVGALGSLAFRGEGGLRPLAWLTASAFLTAGAVVAWLCARELASRRDARTALLVLWTAGFFAFAVALNWTVNARSLVPVAPAVALLAVGACAHPRASNAGARLRPRALAAACAGSLALSLVLAHADRAQALSSERAASELVARYSNADRAVWFLGSWGFQYYAERAGAVRVDRGHSRLQPGDVLLISRGSLGPGASDDRAVRLLERAEFPAACCAATMSAPLGAGFYSALSGPLPYGFGANPPELFEVLEIRVPLASPDGPDPSQWTVPPARS